MHAIEWVRRAGEYAVGVTIVLLHLALGGHGFEVVEVAVMRPRRRRDEDSLLN
jgi:hypothetical protein